MIFCIVYCKGVGCSFYDIFYYYEIYFYIYYSKFNLIFFYMVYKDFYINDYSCFFYVYIFFCIFLNMGDRGFNKNYCKYVYK